MPSGQLLQCARRLWRVLNSALVITAPLPGLLVPMRLLPVLCLSRRVCHSHRSGPCVARRAYMAWLQRRLSTLPTQRPQQQSLFSSMPLLFLHLAESAQARQRPMRPSSPLRPRPHPSPVAVAPCSERQSRSGLPSDGAWTWSPCQRDFRKGSSPHLMMHFTLCKHGVSTLGPAVGHVAYAEAGCEERLPCMALSAI